MGILVDRLLPVPIKHDFGKIQALKSGILGKGSVQRVGLPHDFRNLWASTSFWAVCMPKGICKGAKDRLFRKHF